MEKPERKKNTPGIKRKRRKSSSSPMQNADADTLFAVMLAALFSLNKPSSDGSITIQKCLDQILHSLLSKSPSPIPIAIRSLLPSFLNSKYGEIACTSLEIVGAASLFSFEMNEQIALDREIVKGLIGAVASPKRSISLSALEAVLDLSTTSIGCQQLLEFSAIDKLMSLNIH